MLKNARAAFFLFELMWQASTFLSKIQALFSASEM
jgi:hypothetical protein